MAIAQRRMTLEEFLKLPEEKPALEFVDGAVTQKVSPNAPHGRLQAKFAVLLDRSATPGRRAMVFTETRTSFRYPSGARSLVPDISVYLWDRVPRTPRGRVANDLYVVPDIAIEIVSPGQTVKSQVEQCRWFIEQGASIGLVVNPRTDTITQLRPGTEPRLLRGADRIDPNPVLPGFELTVQELFEALDLD